MSSKNGHRRFRRARIRRRTIYTGGQDTPGLPFQGETMICVMCGREEKSSPGQESQWRAIQPNPPDGPVYYACPAEFPADAGATSEAFKVAYMKIFRKIFSSQSL